MSLKSGRRYQISFSSNHHNPPTPSNQIYMSTHSNLSTRFRSTKKHTFFFYLRFSDQEIHPTNTHIQDLIPDQRYIKIEFPINTNCQASIFRPKTPPICSLHQGTMKLADFVPYVLYMFLPIVIRFIASVDLCIFMDRCCLDSYAFVVDCYR